MGGDGAPSVGHRVAGTAFHHGVGVGKLVVETDERLAVGVESLNGNVHAIVGIVVAALLVFGLVIDDGAVNLDLARREVALKVLHVGGSVPEAPLGEREQLQALGLAGEVLEREFLHLAPFLQGNEEEHRGLHAVLLARDAGVAHAVAALVAVEGRLAGFPSGIPDDSLLFTLSSLLYNIEISSAVVHGHAVVAVARDAAELGVLEERVAAGGIGNQGEEVLVAQVVDPGPGRLGIGDDIFAMCVVEMSVGLVVHI